MPFVGIAFLWFIGAQHDRLGELEDRFFATVFLGSGRLFLTMLFASAPMAGGIIIAYAARPEGLLDSPTFTFAPRCNLRNHEPLRGQDGGSVHDLYVHTCAHRFHPALDCVPRALPARFFSCSAGAVLTGFYWSFLCGCS